MKFVCIKFIRKMGEMRKKGRNVCVNTSFQSISLKRAWDLRVNLLNTYFLIILLIHPKNTYDIGKREETRLDTKEAWKWTGVEHDIDSVIIILRTL